MSATDPVQAVMEVLRAHADGTDRSANDGCYCGQHDDPRTYEDHAARLIIAALNLPAIEREAKAAAWDEGHEAGWWACHDEDDELRNPYREADQ